MAATTVSRKPAKSRPPRGSASSRVREAKYRARRALGLMPLTATNEDGVTQAIVELGKATELLQTELQAMKVRRARDAKRRIPRGGMKDCRGRKRSVATLPGYNAGRDPGNKGKKYPPTPPTVNEVLRMLSMAPTIYRVKEAGQCPVCGQPHGACHTQDCVTPHGERMRALIYMIWRGGLRIECEALRLFDRDLHPAEQNVFIAKGKNGKSREVFIDDWVWTAIDPWLRYRQTLPPGPVFCVLEGPTAGEQWRDGDVRKAMHKLAAAADIRHRVAPHQFRHARAIEDWEAGIDPLIISRNLGHAGLHVTDTYFKGLPQSRITKALQGRPVPTVSMLDVLRNEANQVRRPMPTVAVPDLMGALAR